MKKIRICYPYIGDSIGGSHLSSIELIKKLDKKKFEVILLLHKKGILYNHLIKERLKPKFLKINNFVGNKKGLLVNIFYIFKNIFKLIRYINKNKIDIIHLNDSSAGLTWVIPTRLSIAKLVWHQRIVFPDWKLYKVLSFFSGKIICISKFVHNSLPKFNKCKSIIIYNPVTLKKKKKKKNFYLKKKYFFNSKEKKILFLANIIKSKRIDLFLKTAKIILNKLSNVSFFIVGSDKKKLLDKKIINNYKNKIIYVGYSKEKEFWLKNCNLLLITAENEGLNRTIVEGMLLKIPVVAVNSGAHSEIIKNNLNGWLVPTNNSRLLSKETFKVLSINKNDLKKKLKKAKYYAQNKFSAKKHAKKISNIYFELIN